MQQKTIELPLRVPYATLGELTDQTEYIWVVCHGYGQLAEYFVRHFECLDPRKHFVIAPEGISKFYLQAFSGRVGAVWMTSRNREDEIANYLSMLSAIYGAEAKGAPAGCRTVLLGFSQGAATISRWAVLSDIDFHALTLWGGRFPPDLPEARARERLEGRRFSLHIGLQDKYLDAEQRAEHEAFLRRKGLSYSLEVYEGEHNLYPEPLLAFAASLG